MIKDLGQIGYVCVMSAIYSTTITGIIAAVAGYFSWLLFTVVFISFLFVFVMGEGYKDLK